MRKLLSLFSVLMLFSIMAVAQTKIITGLVKDEKGEAVGFATVTEAGTKNTVKADANGIFTIKVKENAELLITAVGYTERTVVAAGKNVNVTLTTKNEDLKEVVITSGLGVKKRPKEVGVAQSTVNDKDLTNGKSPQLAQALSGKVSGLTVVNANNSVNPAVKIVLRGYRSMTGNNEALIVLDGVPVPQNAIAYLNPNDIDNVTVLKGGQAATLYGSDGVNGALLINTKRGSKAKPTVTFSSAVNVEELSFLPKFQDEFGSGSDYGGIDPSGNFRTYENQQYGDRYDGSIRPLGRRLEDGSVLELPYSAIPNERKKVWQKGTTFTNDISVSGGDQNSRFFLSFQDAKITGIVPKDENRRNSVRMSATKEFGKFTASFVGNYIQERLNQTTSDFYFNIINTAAHIPLTQLKDWKNNKFANPNVYFNDYYENPWFELDNARQRINNNYFNGNVQLDFRPVSWVTVTERIGIALTNQFGKSWQGKFLFTDYAAHEAQVPAPFPNDYDGINRATTNILGGVNDFSSYGRRINNDLFATAKKKFGKIEATAILGSNIQIRKSQSVSVGSSSVLIPELYNVAFRTGELTGGGSESEIRKYGVYGDLTLNYKDFLFVHGTGRFDGSSVFYAKGRDKSLYQYPYYGIDASFIVTEAVPSIKNDVLDYLKLRAALNKNGNDNLGAYGIALTYGVGGGFPYGNTVGTTVGDNFPDALLGPEFVTSREFGFEAALFKNRVNVDFTAYNQSSKKQILPITLTPSTGFASATVNIGETKNWGYEANLKAQVIKNKNLTWEVSARYSFNNNKVISLFQDLQRLTPYGGGFTYAQTTAEIGLPFPYLRASAYARDSATGRVLVTESDGYPVTASSLVGFGNSLPKHQLGLGTTLRYKGFSFSANAEYRGGNVVYHDIGRQMTFTGSAKVTTLYGRAPFIYPNSAYVESSTGKTVVNDKIPVQNGHYTVWVTYYRQIAENFITSGAFWKLRDVSLSYDLPKSILDKVKFMKRATIGVYGRNLLTLLPSNNWYTDPEFSTTTGNGLGINSIGITPPVRAYGANLSITF